ncbi:MAG: hypothetical protein AAF149_13720 [Bacteroidota bacterium]
MPNSITSLALIRHNWEYSRSDYLDTFIPLLGTLILKKQVPFLEPTNLDDLKKWFREEYGLVIPYSPLQTLLRRLVKKGFLKRDQKNYIPIPEKLSVIDTSKKSKDFQRDYDVILARLKLFILNKTNENFEFDELEKGFINFLKQNDQAILFAADQKSFLPRVNSPKKLDHLIGEFITHSHDSDPQVFSNILNITVGYAITGTILYSGFNAFQGRLTGVNIYFDTTFIFNLLGINGAFTQKLATELVNILNSQKVNLYLLQTNQGEVEANLSECLKLMDNGQSEPTKVNNLTFKQCFQNAISNSDLEEILIGLENTLEKHKIKHEVVPEYIENKDYQVDDNALYDIIVETYASRKAKLVSLDSVQEQENREKLEKMERKNNTILRDVRVLSGMFRFRAGRKPTTIKDCNAIFVTTNSSLAYASREFEKQIHHVRHTLPVAITDVFLGTLIWLQSPAEIKNLREKKLLMDCLSAMKPSEKLIKKYTEQIDKLKKKGLINDDMVYLMRAHRSAYNILENKTLGDVDELDEKSTLEIMDELVNQIKQEEILSHNQTTQELQRVVDERDTILNERESLREGRIKDLEDTLDELENRIQFINRKRSQFKVEAERQTKSNFKFVLGLWISSIIVLILSTFHWGWNVMEPIVYFLGSSVTVGSYVYLLIKGRTLNPKEIRDHMIEQRLKRMLNLADIQEDSLERLYDKRQIITDKIKSMS